MTGAGGGFVGAGTGCCTGTGGGTGGMTGGCTGGETGAGVIRLVGLGVIITGTRPGTVTGLGTGATVGIPTGTKPGFPTALSVGLGGLTAGRVGRPALLLYDGVSSVTKPLLISPKRVGVGMAEIVGETVGRGDIVGYVPENLQQ
jgi:hypothetical protein